jgi:hypothetical protein
MMGSLQRGRESETAPANPPRSPVYVFPGLAPGVRQAADSGQLGNASKPFGAPRLRAGFAARHRSVNRRAPRSR